MPPAAYLLIKLHASEESPGSCQKNAVEFSIAFKGFFLWLTGDWFDFVLVSSVDETGISSAAVKRILNDKATLVN